MYIEGKMKDSLKTRLDLKRMGIRQSLYLNEVNVKIVLPPACYISSSDEKMNLCQLLKYIQLPDIYSTNFSR